MRYKTAHRVDNGRAAAPATYASVNIWHLRSGLGGHIPSSSYAADYIKEFTRRGSPRGAVFRDSFTYLAKDAQSRESLKAAAIFTDVSFALCP